MVVVGGSWQQTTTRSRRWKPQKNGAGTVEVQESVGANELIPRPTGHPRRTKQAADRGRIEIFGLFDSKAETPHLVVAGRDERQL